MLYNKYRPEKLSQMYGNEETVEIIKGFVKNKNFPHSVIFYGPSGCGKTTTVRILKKYLNCGEFDYHEINAADVRGIDNIRDIIQQAHLSSMEGGTKFYVLDEAHQLTKEAQNALLKVLEDTPTHVYFFLLTTEIDRLIETIKTRCTQFEFKPLTLEQSTKLLIDISEKEGINLTDDIAELIFDLAIGRPRELLTYLEKIKNTKDPVKALGELSEDSKIIELCRALNNSGTSWKQITKILKNIKDDVETVRNVVLRYFSTVLLNSDSARAYYVLDSFKYPFYHRSRLIIACYEVYSMGADNAD